MFWGLSVDTWNNLIVAFGVLSGAFVLLTGAATYIAFQLQKRESTEAAAAFDRYKLGVDEKVADAKQEGIEAGKAAGDALLQAAQANLRAEQLRADNLALQKLMRPRRLPPIIEISSPDEPLLPVTDLESKFGGIRPFAGTPILIQVVPDFEAQILARDMFSVTQSFGWKPRLVDSRETRLSPLMMSPGVEVTYTRDGKYNDAATALAIGFAKAGLTGPSIIENAVGGPTGFAQGLPVDSDGKPFLHAPGFPDLESVSERSNRVGIPKNGKF